MAANTFILLFVIQSLFAQDLDWFFHVQQGGRLQDGGNYFAAEAEYRLAVKAAEAVQAFGCVQMFRTQVLLPYPQSFLQQISRFLHLPTRL